MKRFKKILYVNDSTDNRAWAMARAVCLAENKQADLSVVDVIPVENPNWLERLFGNNDMNLPRQCPCPVWLMKPGEKSSCNNILAAVDFDPLNPLGSDRDLNREVLELAGLVALSNVAFLHLAHAWISGLIIGNTAEAILDELSCSVLAIKPSGFKTPVRLAE